MKKNLGLRAGLVLLIVGTLMGLAAVFAPESADPSKIGPWYSIVPPLMAISVAIITNQLFYSLLSAVIAGGILISINSGEWGIQTTGATYIYNATVDTTNLQIIAFVAAILGTVGVMIVSGGLKGVVNYLMKYAKGPRSSQFMTAVMGVLIFIDDYTNTMVVGSSMRSMTDKYKVSREKLAYIVDATAAPIAGLAIVSTWIGYEVGLFNEISKTLNLGMDGYAMFFDALTFRFYCILMLVFVFVNVISGRDFGPMAKAEARARKGGGVLAPDAKPLASHGFGNLEADTDSRATALSAVVPISVLFAFLFTGLFLDGGGSQAVDEKGFLTLLSFTTWRDVFAASENGILILAYAGATGLVTSVLVGMALSKTQLSRLLYGAWSGIRACLLACAILILAWSLKGVCDGLMTGPFLVETVGRIMDPVWFPALIFLVAGMTAFATGTSWGVMAILIPTAVPIAFQLDGGTYGLTTVIVLGAILDGAIFGDHCSPISDTTIMSSISSGADHIHHVRTQLPYSLTVALICLLFGYIPAGLGMSPGIGILLGSLCFVGLFTVLKLRDRSNGSMVAVTN